MRDAELNVRLLQAQRTRAVLGHFHLPYRPSRLRLFLWRIFRPAKHRQWVKAHTYEAGSALPHRGYNNEPSMWTRQPATTIELGRVRQNPETVAMFRAMHGDVKPQS